MWADFTYERAIWGHLSDPGPTLAPTSSRLSAILDPNSSCFQKGTPKDSPGRLQTSLTTAGAGPKKLQAGPRTAPRRPQDSARPPTRVPRRTKVSPETSPRRL